MKLKLLILLTTILSTFAANVTLTWDPNTETDIGGYRIYASTNSGAAWKTNDVGNVTRWTLLNAEFGVYQFYATAYNTNLLESGPSVTVSWTNQVIVTPPPPPPPTNTLPTIPVIVTQPLPQTVMAGKPWTIFVTLADPTAVSYQWYKNGYPIANATAPSLSVLSATLADTGNYLVRVANSRGFTFSPNIQITITPVPGPNIDITGYTIAGISSNAWRAVSVNFTTIDLASIGGAAYIVSATPTSGAPPVIITSTTSPVVFGTLLVGDYTLSVAVNGTLGSSKPGVTKLLSGRPPVSVINVKAATGP